MQELSANTFIKPHAFGNLMNIGADLFAQIGDLVNERNLDRQKGICRIFYQLSCL